MTDTLNCPKCNAELVMGAVAVLPAETDLTLSLSISKGQLVQAKTVAGVIENFAAMQEEIAKSLECEASVFIAGLKYENDTIFITFRIANAAKGRVEQGELFDPGAA